MDRLANERLCAATHKPSRRPKNSILGFHCTGDWCPRVSAAERSVPERLNQHGACSGVASPKLVWHLVNTTVAPSERNWFGMAYDASDNFTVLYGGYDPSTPTSYFDTWEYAAGKWTQLHPTSHPSAPSGLNLVYDPALGGVAALGGRSPFGGTFYNDIWLFKAGIWTMLTPTVSPPARSQYAMAYDGTDSEIVLFGGYSGGVAMSDTWTFNGATWVQVTVDHHPSGRIFANIAYDPNSDQTLLSGGINLTTGATASTWSFSHGQWNVVHDSGTPSRVHSPIASLANGTPFFFGGQSGASYKFPLYNSSFEFFGGHWHKIRIANAPSSRSNGGLVYDARDGYVLMFGGGVNPTLWNQTVRTQLASPVPRASDS
jgi:hypothetical protein